MWGGERGGIIRPQDFSDRDGRRVATRLYIGEGWDGASLRGDMQRRRACRLPRPRDFSETGRDLSLQRGVN